jgi:hypothetical protein
MEDPLCRDLAEAVTKGIRLHPRFGRIVIFCVINPNVPKHDGMLLRPFCTQC